MKRSLIAAATGFVTMIGATAATTPPPNKLTMYVDLSEWTPSQTLELDLSSGEYVVIPPVNGWPDGIPMKPRHTGRLAHDVLMRVRLLSDRAFASGINDNSCPWKQGKGPPPLPSNAVGPDGFRLVKNGVEVASDPTHCLTIEAEELDRFVARLFDHRRP